MKTLVLFVAIALGLGVAMWRLTRDRAASDPRRASTEERAPAARPAQLTVTAPVQPPEPVLPPRSEIPPEAMIATQRANLQLRFAAEPIDPGWAGPARQQLRDDLGKFGTAAVRLQNVECRTSLCRAELVLSSREAGASFMQTWLREREWKGPGFVAGDEVDGVAKLVVFLGRPGTPLPYLDGSS